MYTVSQSVSQSHALQTLTSLVNPIAASSRPDRPEYTADETNASRMRAVCPANLSESIARIMLRRMTDKP